MATVLNNPSGGDSNTLFKNDKEKRLAAIEYIDKIFPYFEKDGVRFLLEQCISKYVVAAKLSKLEIAKIGATKNIMFSILHSEDYIVQHQFGDGVTLSVPKGEDALELGGRQAYIEMIKKQKKRTEDEKELQFKKLEYEVKVSKWTYRTYWIMFGTSVVGLIISLVALWKK